MSWILVTGAAGFIGSHVAEALLRRGELVVGIDNINDYYPVALKIDNLNQLARYEGFRFVRADITDHSALVSVCERFSIDRIAHLAARAGVRPSIEAPAVYAQANITGTLNLLEIARSFSVKNFVLTSSSSVYGSSTNIPFREDDSATDRPISPYAATKKACEVLGYTYHHLYGLNVTVIRPFTVYGPRGRPDMAPWLFIEAALRHRPIKVFGDGSSRRDYTFVDDFVSGFINALDRPLGYEVFNLGNSQTVSLREALDVVAHVTGEELIIERHPVQPGDVPVTNADISKAGRLLSFEPKTSFRHGMSVFCDWFVNRHSAGNADRDGREVDRPHFRDELDYAY